MKLIEAANGLYGAWRLLHFDKSALQYFEATPRGFWNSYWAAAIVVPGEAIGSLLLDSGNKSELAVTDPLHAMSVFLGLYAVLWLFFPLVMSYVADAFQRGERFILFVVAWNWARVVRMVILLPAVAIYAAEGTSTPGWGAAIYIAGFVFTLIYAGFVAHAALDTKPLTSTLVVMLEFTLTILLWAVAQAMVT